MILVQKRASDDLFIETFPPYLRVQTRVAWLTACQTMKRKIYPTKHQAPGVSGANPDQKQRTTTSKTSPSRPINQHSAHPDSSDQAATLSVTEEDSAASESEYSSADEEVNEPDREDLSYLCARCRQVDFDNIFSRKGIERDGDPILGFYSEHKVLDDPRCAFCQAMQFIHPSLDTMPNSNKRAARLVVATVQDDKKSRSNRASKIIEYSDMPTASTVVATVQDNAIQGNERVPAEERICLTFGYHYTFGYHQDPLSTLHRIQRWTKRNVELRNASPDDLEFTIELVGYLAEKRTIGADKNALPAASIKRRVNFGMIRKRLKECREEHKQCRRKRGGNIRRVPDMRLIDCRTRNIGPAHEGNVSYAALSYVWGTSGDVEDCYDMLPDNLPNTISDAVLVTQKLRIRYLWIDRYCIRQREPRTKEEKDEKHGQIARMHHIYGGSSITIIAAAGHGPDHGLPGVSADRQSPPIVRLPHRTLFATLPDPKLLVDASAWSKRGWTFQEGLLARRRLVFTDQQIYFECGETGDAEAWEECHEKYMFRFFDVSRNTPLYPYFTLGEAQRETIWPRIDEYTKLTLGDPQKDILNGILGVLTHYEGLTRGYMRHIAGLPVSRETFSHISWVVAFADALCWECEYPGERRSGFPTWSWTGWTCKGFTRNARRPNRIPPDRVRAWSISIERPAGESIDQSDVVPLLERGHDLSQVKFLRLTATSLKAKIILMGGIPEDRRYWCNTHKYSFAGFDNNGDKLGVLFDGVETVSFLNLTDSRLLELPLLDGKIQCTAILMDENRLDIPNHQLHVVTVIDLPAYERRYHATALILIAKEDGFEKVGVSGIDRRALRRIGPESRELREFRLI